MFSAKDNAVISTENSFAGVEQDVPTTVVGENGGTAHLFSNQYLLRGSRLDNSYSIKYDELHTVSDHDYQTLEGHNDETLLKEDPENSDQARVKREGT